ncbi:MAG: cyanophycin synthetase, partial [Anaerovorax sp.]
MIYNAMAAIACARANGIEFSEIQNGLKNLKGVPGRFEVVSNAQGYTAIVDYAHTPDALENLLKTASDFKKGRILCVFGCG